MKKVSGSKNIIVAIKNVGINYLPYIEDLRDKFIKYIDFVPVTSLPNSTGTPITTSDNLFLSLANYGGNVLVSKDMPLIRYDITENGGVRLPIMQKISFQNSFFENKDATNIGKYVLLVIWYDEPAYSRRSKSDNVAVDFLEINILSNSNDTYFPDNRAMVNKLFRNFYLDFPTTTITGNSGITEAQAYNIFITIQKGGYALFDHLPLIELKTIGLIDVMTFSNVIFDFEASYLTIGGNGTLTGYSGKSVFLNCIFEN